MAPELGAALLGSPHLNTDLRGIEHRFVHSCSVLASHSTVCGMVCVFEGKFGNLRRNGQLARVETGSLTRWMGNSCARPRRGQFFSLSLANEGRWRAAATAVRVVIG